MKFSTSKTELQNALQKLSKAVPTRSTLPILGCVLIESSEKNTTLRSTDLEITIQVEISVSLEEPGSTSVPLKTLLDITNELPETRITIGVDDKNKVEIKTDNGEYDLMAKPSDEFPAAPEIANAQKVDVPGAMLKNIINSTSFAVSRDELKPALTGVLFRIHNSGITAVATDGHRLVKYSRSDFNPKGFTGDMIIPRKFLSFMSTQLTEEKVELLIGENHVTAKMGNDMVITRIIDERFPDYESVIPKDNHKTLKIKKEDLLGAIKRVSIFSNKSTHQVALNLESSLCKITTEDPEKSSKAQEGVSAEYDGDPLTIGYNAEYLKDVVTHVSSDNIVANFNTAISAALFNSDDNQENVENLMLLMPIRLND